jgi:type II secretory pathway pseudopilin PulG
MSESLQLDNRPAVAAVGADDEGYMLLGLIVAIALLLLWLGVAATNVAFAIRREREVETARRADQYLRAIRLYYKKFGHYPGSIDQLEKSNNIRFLRRKWEDPLTKTTDWRLISVGQNKTTVKGFFGEPLAGLPTTGIGGPAGSQPAGTSGSAAAAGASPIGAPAGAGGLGAGIGTLGSPATGTAAPAGGAAAGAPGTASGTGTATGTGTGGTNSQSGSSNGLGGTGGAIMGVGTNATGNSILVVNEQTDYQSWEFLYDPRLELLKQQQQLNQGVQSSGAGSFGQTPAGTSPTTPTGSQQLPAAGGGPAPAPTVGTPVQQ